MNEALLVIDAQNEFSPAGKRPVPNHAEALAAILQHVDRARQERKPIAWVRHYNKPHESAAFVPGTWGSELSAGLGPRTGFGPEALFEKEVYGAFAGTKIREWLCAHGVDAVRSVGFYAHMCLSTSAREALSHGYDVFLDVEATGACDIEDEFLGRQSAEEVRRSAFLHLAHMGAVVSHGMSLAGTLQRTMEYDAAQR